MFLQELQHSLDSHGRWRDPTSLQGTSKRMVKPWAAGALLPVQGRAGQGCFASSSLLFLTPGCSAVAPLAPAPVWVTSRLCCAEGKLQAQVSRQQEQWRGGERKEGVGWGVEKSLLGINSSTLGLLASHAVNPFQPLQL